MQARLAYAIKFVADMDRALAFYRDGFGLKLRFASPEWSEFENGDVTLALHLSDKEKAGQVQLGFSAPELKALYADADKAGLTFTSPPEDLHGVLLARMLDCEGAEVSLQAPTR